MDRKAVSCQKAVPIPHGAGRGCHRDDAAHAFVRAAFGIDQFLDLSPIIGDLLAGNAHAPSQCREKSVLFFRNGEDLQPDQRLGGKVVDDAQQALWRYFGTQEQGSVGPVDFQQDLPRGVRAKDFLRLIEKGYRRSRYRHDAVAGTPGRSGR